MNYPTMQIIRDYFTLFFYQQQRVKPKTINVIMMYACPELVPYPLYIYFVHLRYCQHYEFCKMMTWYEKAELINNGLNEILLTFEKLLHSEVTYEQSNAHTSAAT